MIQPPWHVFVLIPARNEEELLPRCLKSVARACVLLRTAVTYDVIVVVDSSTDRTGKIAQRFLKRRGHVVHVETGSVGSARVAGSDAALNQYDGPLNSCWLAHTDADCEVPDSWLVDQISLADHGIEAIAGIVSVDHFADHAPCVAQRFQETYIIHSDGTHPHVHGANLGIRADLYRRVGGWAPLATAEDHDLWNRIVATNRPTVSTSAIQVITSGRRIGRAPDGFAQALAAHNEAVA
jgi:glycosyltransferase involved in cell wall biosynthesis